MYISRLITNRLPTLTVTRHFCFTMATALMPRDSGRFISETSKHVTINREGVTKLSKVMAECIKSGKYSIKSWKEHTLNPKTMDKAALDWIFVADTLNFSFWSADESKRYMVRYKGEEYTGYWSYCAAMNRALDEGIPFTDPNYFATITSKQLTDALRSDSPYSIPMLDQRLDVLQEAGEILVKKYAGSFANVIKKCDKSAQTLLKLIVTEFPSYRDVCTYNGKEVAIYKRAQILIADIWACFEGQGLGEFTDIDSITMFADYRIPQALHYFGAIQYSDELMEYLRKGRMMQSGDPYEMEIRGCSIWATELVALETRQLLQADDSSKDLLVNSILIDHYLWDYRRDHADDMTTAPFHRIRCIYY